MCTDSCFSETLLILFNVFPSWHYVNVRTNAPDQQPAKTSAFTDIFTLVETHPLKFYRSNKEVLSIAHIIFFLFCLFHFYPLK